MYSMVLYAWFCRNISVYMIVLAQFCPPDYGSVYCTWFYIFGLFFIHFVLHHSSSCRLMYVQIYNFFSDFYVYMTYLFWPSDLPVAFSSAPASVSNTTSGRLAWATRFKGILLLLLLLLLFIKKRNRLHKFHFKFCHNINCDYVLIKNY